MLLHAVFWLIFVAVLPAQPFAAGFSPLAMVSPQAPTQIVFCRHGLSTFNRDDMFTGWFDVPLAPEGQQECLEAGKLLAAAGFTFDVAHSSVLQRACISLHRILEGCQQTFVPIKTSWRLNERHYGALQGQSKKKVEEELGDIVKAWRRSFSARPPLMGQDHPHASIIATDPRYRGVDLPWGESLEDTAARAWQYWEQEVCGDVAAGKSVLVVAHANTIRSLIKVLDDISEEDIKRVRIPTGAPFVYRLGPDFRPVGEPNELGFRGRFLKDMLAGKELGCVARETSRQSRCQELLQQNPLVVPEECLAGPLEECAVANLIEASGAQEEPEEVAAASGVEEGKPHWAAGIPDKAVTMVDRLRRHREAVRD